MATAIRPLTLFQIGEESTKGTLVPATRKLIGEGSFSEEQDFYRSSYPAGVRANTGGAGTLLRKGTTLQWESDLSAEDVLWPLHLGVIGNVTPSGASDKTWTFTPELTTGIPTIDTGTIEYAHSDGVTNHFYGECGYALCSGFRFEWAFNQVSKFSTNYFARARQSGTPTAALTAYTGREPLTSNLCAIYLDTTWAGLGGTQLSGVIRSASLDVSTGFEPDYTMDARTDKDFPVHRVGPLTARLQVVMELNATAASRLGNYRANDLVYIRIKNTGSNAVSVPRQVQIDGAYRFTAPPSFSVDGSQILVSFEMESFYDTTGTKTLEFVVINAIAAL